MKKLSNFIYLTALALILLFLYQGCDSSTEPDPDPTPNNTVKGTLTLPATANTKEWVVLIDTDRDGEEYVAYVLGNCGSGTTVNYSFSNIAAGTYYIYAMVRILSASGTPPENGDYVGIYGGTESNPPSNPNAVIPLEGTVDFDITLSVMGGSTGGSMSFNCTQGSFSASGEFDPNFNNDQGAGWLDAETFAAYKVTSSTNMSLALLMFNNSIGTGSYSFPQQAGFGWALNFNPNDQTDYENKICILISGETNVIFYSGNDIQGTFSGNGVFANNQSQTSNITNGLFSVNSTSSPYPALAENVRKIINRIKSKR